MENQKKILTRVQLINWHYFENERISFHGSTLISGENTAGKSTILDAIQLVLTTNTRRFNVAANEKGNRNLKGYVRCKIGNVGETYLRKDAVPANVALEFYEEKGDRYFVIGVHMLSADEESQVVTRWYMEECRLEDLSFMADGHAALANEFRVKNKKITYIDQKNAARDRFKRRLGNLDDKFFDIIPKSLAFKPMDHVKQFINKFVLSEARVDVVSLRENIETLSELESILAVSRRQQEALEKILGKYGEIEEKDHSILVNDILLDLARRDAAKFEMEELEKRIRLNGQALESDRESSTELERQITALDSQILAINVDKESNHSNRMREQAQRRIDELKRDIDGKMEDNKKLAFQIRCLMNYLNDLTKLEYRPVTRREAELLGKAGESEGGAAADGGKAQIVERLETFARKEQIELQEKGVLLKAEMKQVSDEIEECQGRLKNLEKRVLPYPEYARKLKELVEKEFARRGIRSTVYFLSELLEITDHTWNNAIEGYLNTQKFYLVVEPEYYVVALEVYDRNRKQIHTAGIINTRKIPTGHEPDQDSLAAVVKSENRYAKAYADYILGRVKRCADVHELEEHAIAMTPDCMLYQGYVVRHLNPRDYENPFIGQNAYRVQIGNVRRQIEEKVQKRSSLREQISIYDAVLESGRQVNLEVLRLYLNVPEVLRDLQDQLTVARIDLKEAESDPTLIELNIKLEGKEKERHDKRQQQKALEKEIVRLEEQIGSRQNAVKEKNREYEAIREALERKADEEGLAYREADEKYRQNRKSKQPGTIAENYAPRGQQLLNERERLLNGAEGLYGLQMRFNQEFAADFVTGLTGIPDYREALQKLKSVEIVR